VLALFHQLCYSDSTWVGKENSMNVVCVDITNTNLHNMKRHIQASVFEHQYKGNGVIKEQMDDLEGAD
jgi:hypothetical protein